MANQVLRPTDIDPREFIAAVDHPVRRADAEVLLDLLEDVTGQQAAMWGPSIVGFGHYHYRYASGHEGDSCAIGFSPRKANLVFYGLTYGEAAEPLLAKLGKHRRGAGCVYVNKLADIDLAVLRQIAREGYEFTTTVMHRPAPGSEPSEGR
ncbi:DUF1801 domain-containing protein [Arthrobacter sp. NPDC093125]|uniref:DUF1801 domain-containing protein n=1 Tax=Arthrobacter sp. NPDC093125 TaxID=3363944 RepID=UPI00382C7CD7